MKKYVVVDKNGSGISSFDTKEEAALFQYEEKIYLTTEIVEVEF